MEKPKVGDKVHIGHGSKDGAGVKGIVTKIEGDTVHIRSLKAEISDLTKKPTYKQYKGDIRNVTVESEQIDEIDLDWQYKNIMQTKGLSDKAKKQTTDIYNKLKKKEQTIPQKKVAEEVEQVTEQKHRVLVTVSDPNHTAVTKRKEQIQKFVRLTADNESHAVEKTKAYYKKQGYKIHDALHVGMVNEADLEEGLKTMYHKFMAKRAGAKADHAFDMNDEDEFKKQVDKAEKHRVAAGGKPTRINKNPDSKFLTTRESVDLEESEILDEISKDKLRDYKHKAELSEPKDDHGYTNRSKGIERADKKLNKGYASDANAKRGWSNESVEMEQIEEQKHRVAVTVSEPDHPAMSMRKATKQRFIHVSADSAKNAVERAKSYYKKSGYKVHGAEYVSLINEDSTQVEQMKKPYEQFIKSISEAWPGTPEYEAKFGKPKGLSGTTQGNRHDITVKGNVTRAVRRIDPATGHTAEPKQKVDIQDGPKRGRGRPPGKYGAYARKLKESLEIIESLETDEELDSYIDSLGFNDL